MRGMSHVYVSSKRFAGTAGLTQSASGMGVLVTVGAGGVSEGTSVGVMVSAGAHEARIEIRSMVMNIFFI